MQIAEITQQETAERAALLQVESYDVQLDLTQGDQVFRSVSSIRFDCTRPGAASYADLIAAGGARDHPERHADRSGPGYVDGRIMLADLAGHNELRVVADCAYSSDAAGLLRTVDSADGRVYTASHFEPAEARRVYANFEQPDLKAAVHLPRHRARSSGSCCPTSPRLTPSPAGDGTAVWHFPQTPRMLDLPDRGGGGRVPPAARRAHHPGRPADPARAGLPAVAGRLPRTGRHAHHHPAGPGLLHRAVRPATRTPSTTRCSWPTTWGRWRTSAASPSPSSFCSARRSPTPCTSCGPW